MDGFFEKFLDDCEALAEVAGDEKDPSEMREKFGTSTSLSGIPFPEFGHRMSLYEDEVVQITWTPDVLEVVRKDDFEVVAVRERGNVTIRREGWVKIHAHLRRVTMDLMDEFGGGHYLPLPRDREAEVASDKFMSQLREGETQEVMDGSEALTERTHRQLDAVRESLLTKAASKGIRFRRVDEDADAELDKLSDEYFGPSVKLYEAKYPEDRERIAWRDDGRLDEIVTNSGVHVEWTQGDTYLVQIGGLRCFCRDFRLDEAVSDYGRLPGGRDCIVPDRDSGGLPDDPEVAQDLIESIEVSCQCDEHCDIS